MALENPRSTAKVLGHPIHPMLVSFPIAFLVGALLTDLAYWQLRDRFFAEASCYLIGAGVVFGLTAALAGFTDFFGDRRIRALSHAWQHMLGNLLAVGLSAANLYIRLDDQEGALLSTGLYISIVVNLILVFTGWRGGDLVYRHRVGIPDESSDVG